MSHLGEPVNALEKIYVSLDELMPPPFKEDLRAVGIYTDLNTGAMTFGQQVKGLEQKVPVKTDVHAAQARIMTHVIEKKLIPGLYSRGDYARAAIFFYTAYLVKSMREGTFDQSFYLMELEQQTYANRLASVHADKSAEVIRKSAEIAVAHGDLADARESLRRARLFADHLRPGVQERFSNRLYGSADGKARPEHWEGDEVAVLWARVCEEQRDEADDVEVG